MHEEYGTEYGRRNENEDEKGFKWVTLGLIIGLLLGVGFFVDFAYTYADGIIAEQVSQKCTAIMDILRTPIQLSQSNQDLSLANKTAVLGAVVVSDPEVFVQNAEPTVAKLTTNIETKRIDCLPVANDEDPVDPAAEYKTVEVEVRLRDLNTEDLTWLDDAGTAELGADQYVTVWVNLPDGIEKLKARFESSYPAEIKAGDTGTIDVCIICHDNRTKYVGSLTISATDDLNLGTARRYTRHILYSGFEAEHRHFWAVEDESRLHTHAAYALYTSCDSDTEMYDKCNGIYGSDISISYILREK